MPALGCTEPIAVAYAAAKARALLEQGLCEETLLQTPAKLHIIIRMWGEGIIKANVEATINSVGYLATRGMQETDQEILKIMVEQ